jgi:hypothetical protein
LADQTSILRFIEDNWLDGARVSATSFDNIAGPLDDFFDFSAAASGRAEARQLLLDPVTGN